MEHPVKNVALITQNPDFKALWRWLSGNIDDFRSSASKPFNRLVDGKVYTRGIELPVEHAQALTKVLYPFKSILESFVIVFLWFGAVEVAVNLAKSIKSNEVPNNVH